LLPSLTLTAQGLKPANVNDWSQLSTVVSGTSLSVKTKDGKTVEGKLNKISDTALSLTVKNKPADLKREDVQSICQLTKKSATKSTLIGLAVGEEPGWELDSRGAVTTVLKRLKTRRLPASRSLAPRVEHWPVT